MMHFIKYTYKVILTATMMCLAVSSQGQLLHIRDEIGKIIRYESGIDFDIVPGLVIGVWDQQDTAFFSFGQGVSTSDWFELGSLTKPVTAHLATKWLEASGDSVTAPVCRFLPDSLCTGRWNEITVEQLMQHIAGLPRQPYEIGLIEREVDDPYADYAQSYLARDLLEAKPIAGRYSYSHIGYGALSWVFGSTGALHTFGDTYFADEALSMRWQLPDGLVTQGYGFDGRPTMPWHTGALAPALGLKASIAGVVEFIMARQASLAKNYPALSRALKRELKVFEKRGAYKVDEGWFMIRSGKSIIYYHNGRTGGHHGSVAFMPGAKKGVVVLATGTAGSNDLSLSILTMLRRAKKQ